MLLHQLFTIAERCLATVFVRVRARRVARSAHTLCGILHLTHIYICRHAHTHTRTRTRADTRACTHKHTCSHTRAHAYTHTHTHTHLWRTQGPALKDHAKRIQRHVQEVAKGYPRGCYRLSDRLSSLIVSYFFAFFCFLGLRCV